jgi:transposase
VAFELSQKSWRLSLSDGERVSEKVVGGGDGEGVLAVIEWARKRFGLSAEARVESCYEAGRDGFWLHRWLCAHGIHNRVVDSASIEVNRRARRAKSDALDGRKLLSMLMREVGGERGLWSVLRVPDVEQEDRRRDSREHARLTQERAGHVNRIKGLLVLHNVRALQVGGAGWAEGLEQWGIPARLRAELEREGQRLALVQEQLKALAKEDRAAACSDAKCVQLQGLMGIGPIGTRVLTQEVFGWRKFANRRELAASVGLAPTPYNSGDSEREQGVSKAGNRRVRALLVELAWGWIRYQPDSALTRWWAERFGPQGKRSRRVGIVALARKLLIALWRYLEDGVIPKGARLKPA